MVRERASKVFTEKQIEGLYKGGIKRIPPAIEERRTAVQPADLDKLRSIKGWWAIGTGRDLYRRPGTKDIRLEVHNQRNISAYVGALLLYLPDKIAGFFYGLPLLKLEDLAVPVKLSGDGGEFTKKIFIFPFALSNLLFQTIASFIKRKPKTKNTKITQPNTLQTLQYGRVGKKKRYYKI